MDQCNECKARSVKRETVPEYRYDRMSIPVVLYNSVIREVCESCGEEAIEIPSMKGLIAAVAVSRVMRDQKLKGRELKFLRSALDKTSSEIAAMIDVTVETVSRWENDRAPIPPSSEKLIRYFVGSLLEDEAPAVFFDQRKVAEMKIRAIVPEEMPPMGFERVSLKVEKKKASEPHWDCAKTAA